MFIPPNLRSLPVSCATLLNCTLSYILCLLYYAQFSVYPPCIFLFTLTANVCVPKQYIICLYNHIRSSVTSCFSQHGLWNSFFTSFVFTAVYNLFWEYTTHSLFIHSPINKFFITIEIQFICHKIYPFKVHIQFSGF